MQLIKGPPRDIVFGWAHDFAEAAVQIYQLPGAETPEREQAVEKMKAAGDPASLDELVELAASTVLRHQLGWYRRNQFLGSLQGFCVLMGMPRQDAIYLAGLVQAKVRQGAAA